MPDPTSLQDVDTAIDALSKKKDEWPSVSIADRIALLERCIESTLRQADKWAEVGADIKGLSSQENLAGEEWLAGIMPTIRNARLLIEALRAKGQPRPAKIRSKYGRKLARVFPSNLMERVLFMGMRADVWIEKGKPTTQGAIYRNASTTGKVCLILGGGNVSSIPPMDALYKLFVENEVVLLKMNPVNEALGPILEKAFAPLAEQGVLRIIYGGADVGTHAAQHAQVDSLHVTGSDRTYDAIVWGPGSKEEQAARKSQSARANERPFSAELGCVTPILVVPGPWSDADIRFQARHVASMVTHNASFNCNAAKVVIIAKQWLQRDAFRTAFQEELAKAAPRKAYYPGAKQRYAAFLEAYPNARVLGSTTKGTTPTEDVVPWTIIPASELDTSSYALENEAFCGVVAELEIDAPDYAGAAVPRFLEEAVKVANERCWGTLSCALLIHPATVDAHTEAIQNALEHLRYGSIGINIWPGAMYALCSPTWGAHPGHGPEDIQSGVGVVHNTYMFDHPEKTVMQAPFRIRPTPPWFHDHRNLLELGRRLVEFEAAPTWGKLQRVALAAFKG